MLTETIEEFGRGLGLPELAMNDAGAVQLTIGGVGTLLLELQGEELWVTLSRQAEHQAERLADLMRAVHWRRHPAYGLHAGFFRDRLVLTAQTNAQTVTAQDLDRILRLMNETLSTAIAP